MFRIVHSLLKCTETRSAILNFLANILVVNSKMTHLLVQRRLLSTDGLMFNLLYLLQHLNSKVKVTSVSYNTLLMVIGSVLQCDLELTNGSYPRSMR